MGGGIILLLFNSSNPDPIILETGDFACALYGAISHVGMRVINNAYLPAVTNCYLISNKRVKP